MLGYNILVGNYLDTHTIFHCECINNISILYSDRLLYIIHIISILLNKIIFCIS